MLSLLLFLTFHIFIYSSSLTNNITIIDLSNGFDKFEKNSAKLLRFQVQELINKIDKCFEKESKSWFKNFAHFLRHDSISSSDICEYYHKFTAALKNRFGLEGNEMNMSHEDFILVCNEIRERINSVEGLMEHIKEFFNKKLTEKDVKLFD
ncbi:hypothetical protein H312_03164 [Anncaliia algerae PRA339]|uniref:Uncharacterized protein n=1 Tax=Anncaliia algerae PRA339 TaxID=1288291 RepID=A0A059EXG9_9MICR|nr:hypothetical protein H312_03164 [Anncaliia algerae PRA339]